MDVIDSWISEAEGMQVSEGIQVPVQEDIVQPALHPNKVVSWIDVLGMRQKIKDIPVANAIEIMEELHEYVNANCESLRSLGKLDYIQVSDGFIIIADLDCFDKICEILCNIQWDVLVYLNMNLRGALTAGAIGINGDGTVIVGPAFIDAFKLESENAIFPRVILSNAITDYIQESTFEHIKTDVDNIEYLDFIAHIKKSRKLKNKNILDIFEKEHVISSINKEYEGAKSNVWLMQKYGWLINRFNFHGVDLLESQIGCDK